VAVGSEVTGMNHLDYSSTIGIGTSGGINFGGTVGISLAAISIHITLNEYDALDRVTEVTLPDKSVSSTRYGVAVQNGKRHHLVEQTDPLGNISVRYSDARGNVMRVERSDGKNNILTSARYEYNNMGEMLRALDAAGNPLAVEYDMMGRRTAMESADMGRSEYAFNAAGQLESETTSELRRQGRRIRYEYDEFGRNTRIAYPFMQNVTYEYGPPEAASRNLAGRLIKVTDESGTLEYEYGKLGETVREKRVLKQETGYLTNTREAVMEYYGNYVGQMEKIIYPDGEEISYGYDYGGNVVSVTGINHGVTFAYVEHIGYDEWNQRVYMKLGNGVETAYKYDEKRRWLAEIKTAHGGTVLQNIVYRFDAVGNVDGYKNNAGTYTTEQNYTYDGLYQLTGVEGISRNYQFGVLDYTARYNQEFRFDELGLGNMVMKTSAAVNSGGRVLGDALDYQFDYEYYPGTRKASRIGNRHYLYDLNGNLTAEKDGPFEAAGQSSGGQIRQTGNGTNYVEGGWGLDGGTGGANAAANLREYRWNERNRMTESIDSRYNVKYTYGHDGERTGKHAKTRAGGSESETLYFNRMWNWRYDGLLSDRTGTNSKHVFLGDTRILTKVITADGSFTAAERVRQYYYHSDHLGSAQLITDYKGDEYERLEYTPYGEMWIDKAPAVSVIDIPYRFTGKEQDSETGLHYYGARYLDSRTGRWLSGDPAVGEYVPSAPVNDEAKKQNESLPGMGGVFNYANLHVYHYAGNNPVKYVDPDGRAVPIVIAAIIFVAKAGAVSAAVSGVIDVASQALESRGSPEGFSLDAKRTGAAMAGGFVAGVVTGGASIGAGLLGPILAKGAIITGGAAAGAAGSATTTAIDNNLHNRPVSQNMAENVVVGTITGTISGALTKAPTVPFYAQGSYEPITTQAVIRETGKEMWNGIRDEIISKGVQELADH